MVEKRAGRNAHDGKTHTSCLAHKKRRDCQTFENASYEGKGFSKKKIIFVFLNVVSVLFIIEFLLVDFSFNVFWTITAFKSTT